MYTDAMRMAFRSLDHYRPKSFAVSIEDNENFLVIRASEPSFMPLLNEEKRQAIEYMIRLKKAFEENGAVVLIVREGGKPA
jgi:hypothetical protein